MENSFEEAHENHEVEEQEEHEEQEEQEENDAEEQEEQQSVEGEEEQNVEGEEEQNLEGEEEQGGENEEEQEENNEEGNEQQEEVEEETEQNEEEADENEESDNANNESDEEFTGFGEEEIPVVKSSKKRQILTDDSDEDQKEKSEDEDESISRKKKKHKKHKSHKKSHKKHKNREEGEDAEAVGDEEDEDEEEETEKEVQEELNELNEEGEENQSAQQEDKEEIEDNEASNQEAPTRKKNMGEQTNLERVLANQKAENKRKSRRKNVDSEELNDIDNTISMIIAEMKNVAAEDRAANEKSLTSIGKIKMSQQVITLLQKSDYHSNMIDLGILGAIAEWLAPLPDRSLPNIKIRDALIDALRDFGDIGSEYLKSSGVGKAVMFLYKHPKETKANKQKLEKLIHNWSRPIFNLDANFKAMSKEERLQRDIEQVRSMRRNSGDGPGQSVDELLSANDKKKRKHRRDESDRSESEDPNKVLRPGDPGFVPRARVPAPSHKDYVIRPKSNIEVLENNAKKGKKSESRLEKHQKKFVEFKRTSKFQRAVTLSINDKH